MSEIWVEPSSIEAASQGLSSVTAQLEGLAGGVRSDAGTAPATGEAACAAAFARMCSIWGAELGSLADRGTAVRASAAAAAELYRLVDSLVMPAGDA